MVTRTGATPAPAPEDTAMQRMENFLVIPLGKRCVLALTPEEYLRGIRRGKWLRRREAMLRREAAR